MPWRQRPSHHPVIERGNRAILVFLTVCTRDRKPILADPAVHALLRESWSLARDWRVGRYVLMPDHMHLFCAPGRVDYPPLRAWVKFWRSWVSMRWPRPEEQPIWQRDCWDTQMRRGQSYGEKWEYVRRNPVRAGLCKSAEEWAFQGEMNVLMWHDA
jgi:REP element-mobilizing transposase RayT